MTSVVREISRSLKPTTSSTYQGIKRFVVGPASFDADLPSSLKSNIYTIVEQFVTAPIPKGFRDIDEIIKERELNPRRAAALARARKRLAEKLNYDETDITVSGLRLRMGLSQAQVAKHLGNSQSSYSIIESGKRTNIMTDTFERLKDIFQVSRDTLAVALSNSKKAAGL